MKGVFGLLLIIGGGLLAWLDITGKINIGGTSSATAPAPEQAVNINEPGPGPEKATGITEANAGQTITTPGSTTGGQQR